ncbi:MAG: recognition motif protein [Candidatus Paceibacter sp.]|jgi:RNA recognition motif-containing protein|nr:recognition motif protein [Candidatus Paceibacter sp.]
MAKKLYVGGVAYSTTQQGLQDAFAAHGRVVSAQIIMDRETGRSRGFGFVEVEDTDVDAIIQAMNGATLDDRRLTVNEARPMTPRAPRTGGYDRNRSSAGSNDWGMNS